MKIQKSQQIKKQKKTSTKLRKSSMQKQKEVSLEAPQLRTSQLENYKAFFQYLLSNNIDNELADVDES